MADAQRFAYTALKDVYGKVTLRPLLPLTLYGNNQSIDMLALVDTGADVSVLPYGIGLTLGGVWEDAPYIGHLSGNLGQYETRGIAVMTLIKPYPLTMLSFGWSRSDDSPIILGQVPFLHEFVVCFFRAREFFEVAPRQLVETIR